jgi:hypothetical protein
MITRVPPLQQRKSRSGASAKRPRLQSSSSLAIYTGRRLRPPTMLLGHDMVFLIRAPLSRRPHRLRLPTVRRPTVLAKLDHVVQIGGAGGDDGDGGWEVGCWRSETGRRKLGPEMPGRGILLCCCHAPATASYGSPTRRAGQA